MARTAVVAGSTGLVGSQLLQKLLQSADYDCVIALTRRPLALQHAKLRALTADFDELSPLLTQLRADDAFCCLGTTQAKAGGRAGLERVDYHMAVDFARAARKAGATRLFVVSAIGSSLRSPSFYSRTKARMQAAVAEIDYATIQIVQPSLLLGARKESRPLEDLSQRVAPLLAPLLLGSLQRYRPISAAAVAEALLQLARDESARGVHIHPLPL
ncbi:MAG: hypothetical protein JWR16_3502 [Nevskia sp.]|nr:hypothetical protein [Nevskia sp.]